MIGIIILQILIYLFTISLIIWPEWPSKLTHHTETNAMEELEYMLDISGAIFWLLIINGIIFIFVLLYLLYKYPENNYGIIYMIVSIIFYVLYLALITQSPHANTRGLAHQLVDVVRARADASAAAAAKEEEEEQARQAEAELIKNK